MVVIGLPALADVFIWALLIMALAAGGWMALFTCHLTMASARACSAIPVLGIALPALYRLVAVRFGRRSGRCASPPCFSPSLRSVRPG